MYLGCADNMHSPFLLPYDQSQNLLGERDNDRVGEGQGLVRALRGVMRFQRQTRPA